MVVHAGSLSDLRERSITLFYYSFLKLIKYIINDILLLLLLLLLT